MHNIVLTKCEIGEPGQKPKKFQKKSFCVPYYASSSVLSSNKNIFKFKNSGLLWLSVATCDITFELNVDKIINLY